MVKAIGYGIRNTGRTYKQRAFQAAARIAQKYGTPKNAARVMKSIYNYATQRPSKQGANRKPKAREMTRTLRNGQGPTGHSVGVYAGKFKKTKKIKRTIEQKCLSSGAHRTMEQYGTFSDPDCVYIHHSTSHFDEIAKVMNACLLRKIFDKANFKITNILNEIANTNPTGGLNQPENSSGIKIVLTCRNAITGDYTNYFYNTLDNQSFKDICLAWTDMEFRFIDYMRGDNKDEIYKLAIYRLDVAGVTGELSNWRLGAEMYLEDISVELHLASNLVIQNRTKAANVTTDDGNLLERVDTQPLKGYIYDFKHADPRVRHSGGVLGSPASNQTNVLFNSTTEAGIQIIRGAEYVGAAEPFDPKYFANISKSSSIKLQPGEMKRTSFSHKFSGKLVNVMKRLRVARRIGGILSGVEGKCQMIALEELLRTPSANKITIAYERELKTGCIVKENRRPALIETFMNTTEINNN